MPPAARLPAGMTQLQAACQSAATLQAHSVIVCSDQTHQSMCFWTLNSGRLEDVKTGPNHHLGPHSIRL